MELRQMGSGSGVWVAKVLHDVVGEEQEKQQQYVWKGEKSIVDAMDHCWEMLHLGDYNKVADAWRKAYGVSTLIVSLLSWTRGDWKEAMRLVDLVLLMGHGELHAFAHQVASKVGVNLSLLFFFVHTYAQRFLVLPAPPVFQSGLIVRLFLFHRRCFHIRPLKSVWSDRSHLCLTLRLVI